MAVIGTDYLGATHAATMAELGPYVVGVDVDEAKVARLRAGDLPFYERGLASLLRRHIGTSHLRFTTSLVEAVAGTCVQFLCVGTPQKEGEYAAD